MANILQKIMGTGDEPATAGHNNPPSDMDILQERLRDSSGSLLKSVDELLATPIPAKIETPEEAGQVADTVKAIAGLTKKLESTRVAEKEPYLALTRAVDGFFKVPTEKLAAAKVQAQKPLTDYLKEQELQERLRRNEEAKRLREQAEAEARAAESLETMSPKIADIALVQAGVTEQQAAHMESKISARPADLAQARGIGGALGGLRTRWVGELADRQTLDLDALRPYFTADALQKAINAYVVAGNRTLKGARIYEKTDSVVR